MPRIREPAPDVTRIHSVFAKPSPRRYRKFRREAANEEACPAQRTPCRTARQTTRCHLSRLRRFTKTPGAALGVDGLAHVSFRNVHALTARGAHQGVIMKGGDDSDSTCLRDPGQIEREVEEVMNVQHVGCRGIEDVTQLGVDTFRRVQSRRNAGIPNC